MQPGSQSERGKTFLVWSVQVVSRGWGFCLLVWFGLWGAFGFGGDSFVCFMVKTVSSFICRSKGSLISHGFLQTVREMYLQLSKGRNTGLSLFAALFLCNSRLPNISDG